MKLIDKDALVAEIERRRDAALMRQRNLETIGDESILNELIADGLNRLIAFIDTIEVKEEELTEFEKEYKKLYEEGYADGQAGSKPLSDKVLKECAIDLLDLARKELQPEIDKELDKAYKTRDEIVYLEGYEKGQEDVKKIPSNPDYETFKNELAAYVEDVKNDMDCEESLDYWTDRLYRIAEEIALKDLPKWKKVDSNPPKVQYNLQGKRLYKDAEYYIELSDLETLPKEE